MQSEGEPSNISHERQRAIQGTNPPCLQALLLTPHGCSGTKSAMRVYPSPHSMWTPIDQSRVRDSTALTWQPWGTPVPNDLLLGKMTARGDSPSPCSTLMRYVTFNALPCLFQWKQPARSCQVTSNGGCRTAPPNRTRAPFRHNLQRHSSPFGGRRIGKDGIETFLSTPGPSIHPMNSSE